MTDYGSLSKLGKDQYIKDSKVEICRGGRSTVSTRGGSTMNTVEAIASFVDPGGMDQRSLLRGSTVNFNFHMKRQSLLRGSTVNFNFHVKRQSPHVLILGGGGGGGEDQ